MQRTVQRPVRALALALAGLASATAIAAAAEQARASAPFVLAQATGTPGSSAAPPTPPSPPSGSGARGSGASIFDTPEEREHSGVSNSASGIKGSARVPQAIHGDRPPSHAATQPFAEVDRNSDGILDRDEARAVRGLNFERVDTNRNGRIEPREYEADAQARRK